MNFNKKTGKAFTLAEMMVVLLILSIIMAAFLPVITTRSKATPSSPWKYSSNNSDIYFGTGAVQGVAIGASSFATGDNSRLLINNTAIGPSHILFKEGGTELGKLTIDSNNNLGLGATSFSTGKNITTIGLGTKPYGDNSVIIGNGAWAVEADSIAIGSNAKADAGATPSIVIGKDAYCSNSGTTIIGSSSQASALGAIVMGNSTFGAGEENISIGNGISSSYPQTVSIGTKTATGGSGSIAIGTFVTSNNDGSIAIGNAIKDPGTATCANGVQSIAIGTGAQTKFDSSIAIGGPYDPSNPSASTFAGEIYSIAIGSGTTTVGPYSLAIGYRTFLESGLDSIAIGPRASIIGKTNSNIAIGADALIDNDCKENVAIGAGASIVHSSNQSVAIGYGTVVDVSNQIKLGADSSFTVYIPGGLTVDRDTYNTTGTWLISSDRRLKNVNEEFSSGLNEIRQLEVFNYTFKKDKDKKPRVGVIAQDLQKIFPDAVTKDKKGFLAIRQEDMFYSMINAIKELDNIVQGIIKDFKTFVCKIEKIEDKITALIKVDQINSKKIKELEAKNKLLEERLAKLEKSK